MGWSTNSPLVKWITTSVSDLYGTTAQLIGEPRRLGQEFASPEVKFLRRAIAYFISALSAAIILTNLAHLALGISAVEELSIWAWQIFLLIAVALLTMAISLAISDVPSTAILKAAFLSFGGALLFGSFFLAVAAATVWVAHATQLIPNFTHDLETYKSFVEAGMSAYYDCLKNENILFRVIYNGLGGAFEMLRWPIDGLSYVQPMFDVWGAIVFGILVGPASRTRHLIAAMVPPLSGIIVFSAALFGVTKLEAYLNATTVCSELSTNYAEAVSAKDQVRILAERHRKNLGRQNDYFTLLAADPRENALVLTIRVNESATTQDGFRVWVDGQRRRLVDAFCKSSWGNYYARVGISQVWVYQYADTNVFETVVQSADACQQ
jgi:hypothetical protein